MNEVEKGKKKTSILGIKFWREKIGRNAGLPEPTN